MQLATLLRARNKTPGKNLATRLAPSVKVKFHTILSSIRKGCLTINCGKQLAIVCRMAAPIGGQSARSALPSKVTDPSGPAIGSANVTVENMATGLALSPQTGEGGSYTMRNLPPGTYRAKEVTQGFRSKVVNEIVVNLDQTVRIDVKLEIGDLARKVEVAASAPVIQTGSSSDGQIVDGKQILTMPLNGRQNLFGLLALAPGVQNPAMNPYVAGNGGFGAVNLTIGGVSGNDAGNERNLAMLPSLESVGEFKVIANNASADFGRGGA